MIEISNLQTDHFTALSARIEPGMFCTVRAASEFICGSFVQTLSGLNEPQGGSVAIKNVDMYRNDSEVVRALFRSLAIVWQDGGMVSNLKIWENLALPLWYHYGRKLTKQEERLHELYRQMGKSDEQIEHILSSAPAALAVHDRMIAGLVRAFLMDPEIIIYDAVLEGISPRLRSRLNTMIRDFHAQRPGRISLLVGTQANIEEIHSDLSLVLE